MTDGPSTNRPAVPRSRYRFGEFVVSPGRRLLLRGGTEVPVIPRYFDVLVLLIERRHEAVHRSEIIDQAWSDVVVSDGALSQAVRTLRRALGEDPRALRFIRTVARYGYQFVFPGVVEENDATEPGGSPAAPQAARDSRRAGLADGHTGIRHLRRGPLRATPQRAAQGRRVQGRHRRGAARRRDPAARSRNGRSPAAPRHDEPATRRPGPSCVIRAGTSPTRETFRFLVLKEASRRSWPSCGSGCGRPRDW